MLVRELMTADVVTVGVDGTLDDAVEKLLEEGVGSVLVVDEGVPLGLITESDALEAAHDRGAPLQAIGISDLAHPPLVTVDQERTVQSVARTMAEEGVKKVVVTQELDVVGIVTLTDIVYHLADLQREAVGAAEEAADREWETDD